MWKWFKRLLILVIVLFLAVVALLIPDKIDSQDQLKNVSTQTSLVDLAPGWYRWGIPIIRWPFNRD